MYDESTVIIENEILLDILNNRVEHWTKGTPIIQTLYSEMYENMVDGGYFDGCHFNPYEIVDNDYVNYCDVLHFDDPDTAPNVGDDYESEDYGLVFIEARYDTCNNYNGVYCLARLEY